jgi:flagellar biosynthesis protein FlhB
MSRKRPSKELSIGEVISESFAIYSANFMQYLIPFLAAAVVTGFLTTLVSFAIIVPAFSPPSVAEQLWSWLWAYLGLIIASALATAIISWIVGYIAQGIAVKFTSDTLDKGQANLQTSFNFTMSKLLSILAASIITGILIFVGLLALIIPGIILAIMFSLVVQTIIVEDTGALESLSRSRRLVSNRWLKTFVLLLVLYIILGIVSVIAGQIARPFGLVSSLVSNIITAFIQPILPIGLTLHYYSMMARTAPQSQPQPTQTTQGT